MSQLSRLNGKLWHGHFQIPISLNLEASYYLEFYHLCHYVSFDIIYVLVVFLVSCNHSLSLEFLYSLMFLSWCTVLGFKNSGFWVNVPYCNMVLYRTTLVWSLMSSRYHLHGHALWCMCVWAFECIIRVGHLHGLKIWRAISWYLCLELSHYSLGT